MPPAGCQPGGAAVTPGGGTLLAGLGPLRSGGESLARQRLEVASPALGSGHRAWPSEAERRGKPVGLHPPQEQGWPAARKGGALRPVATRCMELG